MTEVLIINPKRRRKAAKKTTPRKRRMAKRSAVKRKTTRRTTAKRRTAPRRKPTTRKASTTMARRKTRKRRKTRAAPRRNPSRARRTYRRAASRARSTFFGLNFRGALKNVPLTQLGMFGAKWLAKRFGGGALHGDPESWDTMNYIKGGLGAIGAGFIAENVKRGCGQKVLEGGLNLMIYEMIQNELIPGSDWATEQFGQDDEYYPDEYLGGYEPGDVETNDAGVPYMLGQDYQWRELPEVSGVGDVLEPVGPLGQMEPVGPLGTDYTAYDDRYRAALFSEA